MLVTVFADAGHCPYKKVGGWGGWCKSERGRKYEGGPLAGYLNNSTEAELRGCVKAIVLSLKSGVARPGDTILLQCDNTGALKLVTLRNNESTITLSSGNSTTENNIEALKALKAIVDKYNLKIITRHVKGHKGNVTPRNAVNEICDNLATKGLNLARKLCN